jgi:hypothetical protein
LLYKLNEKTITEKYCVNKQVKNSCCHGSCHLKKTLAKSDEQNNKNPFSTTNIKLKEIELFFKNDSQHQLDYTALSETKTYFSYSSAIAKGYSFSLIKPPSVLG